MRVLICPDKYAGTINAADAAAAIAAGWASVAPDDMLVLRPLSDGGPGFLDALGLDGSTRIPVAATDPLGRPVRGEVMMAGATAYVESAQACGLHLLATEERKPRITTSYGLGALVLAAVAAGATEVVIGLGGSATNDGGAGLLAALGRVPVDAGGVELPPGGAALRQAAALSVRSAAGVATDVSRGLDVGPESDAAAGADLARGTDVRAGSDVSGGLDVEPESDAAAGADLARGTDVAAGSDVASGAGVVPELGVHPGSDAAGAGTAGGFGVAPGIGARLVGATDVEAPLTGIYGASAIFGPQKGAGRDDVMVLDAALEHFAGVLERDLGIVDLASRPGAGAAGGIGAAILALGGELRSGIGLVRALTGFDAALKRADLVITGEGLLDAQSLRGKVVGGIANAARDLGVPCIVLAGGSSAGRRESMSAGVTDVYTLREYFGSVDEAMARPAEGLRALGARVAGQWSRSVP